MLNVAFCFLSTAVLHEVNICLSTVVFQPVIDVLKVFVEFLKFFSILEKTVFVFRKVCLTFFTISLTELIPLVILFVVK